MLTLAAGAVGEFGPLLLLSLLPLEGHTTLGQSLGMLGFVVFAFGTTWLVLRAQTPRFIGLLQRGFHKSSQLPVRITMLLLALLSAVAVQLGLEVLIGAFVCGMILGLVTRGEDMEPFHHKLDGVGFGLLIPIFFVVTGIRFDLKGLLASPTSLLCLPLFLVLFLLVRGLPVLLYRRELAGRDRLALAFYSAAALPLVVAVTELGVSTGQMTPTIAAALVGAAMISILIYPQVALALRAGAPPEDAAKPEEVVTPTESIAPKEPVPELPG
jgi:Kef-type K+ transport system membrane component KefB